MIGGPFSQWERSIAGRYLRAKRRDGGVALISAISFIGVTLAVAVLIIVMSVMNGFRAELLGRMLGFNGHLYVQGSVLNGVARESAAQRIRGVPGVIEVAPLVEAQAMAMGPGPITGAIVRGINPSDLAKIKIIADNLDSGSLDGFGEGEDGGDLVIIGSRLARNLGVNTGDAISVISPSGPATAFGAATRTKDYIVGGVFTVGMSQYDETYMYMPLQQAQLFFGRDDTADFMEVKVADPDKAKAMKGAVEAAAGRGALVSDWTDRNMSFFSALEVERNTMRLILMLLVAIAAMNIISGLVMLVKNKGRDIAILRTMGATRASVMRIFFITGAAIGIVGTLAGFALGVLICLNIEHLRRLIGWLTDTDLFSAELYYLSQMPAEMDSGETASVVIMALILSILATLYPSWRASRLDPVEALRYE